MNDFSTIVPCLFQGSWIGSTGSESALDRVQLSSICIGPFVRTCYEFGSKLILIVSLKKKKKS